MSTKTNGLPPGYGNVASRIDESPPRAASRPADVGSPGGESGGGARPEPVETTEGGGSPGGQTDPVYRGGDNPNSVRKERDA